MTGFNVLTVLVITVVLLLLSVFVVAAGELPHRFSTKVESVFESYIADEWIISPDEEPQDIEKQYDYGIDIKGVLSAYDEEYLRFDLLLYNPVVLYADPAYYLYFYYTDNDYDSYIFSPMTEELVYKQVYNDQIMEKRVMDAVNSPDLAGVSDDGLSVYFIINKAEHFGGKKGGLYYITIEAGASMGVNIDFTPQVNVEYER